MRMVAPKHMDGVAFDTSEVLTHQPLQVGHRRFGHVQWRVPVDVRSLDLDAIVSFSKNTVEVWPHPPQNSYQYVQ